jgi:hypothetical protein
MPVSPLEALVAVETVVIALLAVVVVGLLRSHAEILRRLPANDATEPPAHREGMRPPGARPDVIEIPDHLPTPRGSQTEVVDIEGTTLDGTAVVMSPARTDTLLAFLSSGCLTCRAFWDGMRSGASIPLPGETRLVVVVKDRDLESPARLRDLAPSDVPVVMSSKAWADYGVPMSPYFLFIASASGTVRSEGSAGSWEQVRSLLRDAIEDEALLAEGRSERAG